MGNLSVMMRKTVTEEKMRVIQKLDACATLVISSAATVTALIPHGDAMATLIASWEVMRLIVLLHPLPVSKEVKLNSYRRSKIRRLRREEGTRNKRRTEIKPIHLLYRTLHNT